MEKINHEQTLNVNIAEMSNNVEKIVKTLE